MTMDLHASQIQGFFDLPHDHLYSSAMFNNHIRNLNLKNLTVVSPDVGSIKLARATAKALDADLAIVDKRRSRANQSEVMNIIGDVKDRSILIRDDMVDTGGSICNAAEFLKIEGALEIVAACTHGVLSGSAIERISKSPIRKMVISDSIDNSGKDLPKTFEVLTCADLIGEAIRRIADEESVSSLFEERVKVE
jgi:ribose-phosphate pyrophosphokinase